MDLNDKIAKGIKRFLPIFSGVQERVVSIDDFLSHPTQSEMRDVTLEVNGGKLKKVALYSDPVDYHSKGRAVEVDLNLVNFYTHQGGKIMNLLSQPNSRYPQFTSSTSDGVAYFSAGLDIVDVLSEDFKLRNLDISLKSRSRLSETKGHTVTFKFPGWQIGKENIVIVNYNGYIQSAMEPWEKYLNWKTHEQNKKLYDAGTFLLTSVGELKKRDLNKGFADDSQTVEFGILEAANSILKVYANNLGLKGIITEK
jgi:hypothetical protein